MLHARKALTLAAGAVALAVAAAGCGSGSSSGNSGGNSGSIKVMAVGLFSSSVLSLPDMEAGFKAKVAAINAKGGINGRKIDLITCNDKFDPNVSLQCARQAVSEKVVAVLPGYVTYPGQIIPTLQAAGIPYLYGTVAADIEGTSPIAYPLDAGSAGQYFSLGLELTKEGCKKVGAVVASNVSASQGAQWLQKAVVQGGGTLDDVSAGNTQADFSAPVAKLVADKVGCLVPIGAPDQGVEVVQASRQQAPDLKIGADTTEFGTSQLTAMGSAANGIVMTGQFYRTTDTEEAAIKEVVQDFKTYQPKVPLADGFGVQAWSVVDAFSQLVASVKGSITASSLTAAAKSFTPKVPAYGPLADKALYSGYPRVRNWSYVVWTVRNGKAVLNSDQFTTPSKVG